MSMVQGLNYFVATLPIAFAGLFSGIAQGRVAAAGSNFSEETRTCNKGIIYAAMVETCHLRVRNFLLTCIERQIIEEADGWMPLKNHQ